MAESIFQTYRNRLTDLSSKNKSLYLAKTEGSGFLDLKEFDFLNGESSFEIIRKAISSKKEIGLLPEVDPRIGSVNQLSKALSRISFRNQLTQEETGDHTLFIGWPFVEGKLINGQVVRSPILLLGVGLKLKNGLWKLKPHNLWRWNPSFILAYNHAYRQSLEEEQLNEALEALSGDPTEFRTGLSNLLNKFFSIQLSAGLFEDQLTPFPVSQVSLDSNQFSDGKIAVKTYALLGQYSQKGSFLFREYEHLEERFGRISIESLFVTHFADGDNLPVPREDQLFPVFPLDASQENVLLHVRQGKSLVVEGPPGTGKSQLIANLVTDFCSRGKKVLVISQKRAALDVVFERLRKAGFGDFMGLVHDFRADQKQLFKQIKAQIESIEAYQELNRGIDSIQLDRDISHYSKTISRLSEQFEEFRMHLKNADPAGIPIKAMYLKANLEKPIMDSPDELLKLNHETAQKLVHEYSIYYNYQRKFKGSFWEIRNSFAHIDPTAFPRISQTLKDIDNFRKEYLGSDREFDHDFLADNFLSGEIRGSELRELADDFANLKSKQAAISILFDSEEFERFGVAQEWIDSTLQVLKSRSFDFSLSPDLLEELEVELKALKEKVGSWLGKLQIKWNAKKYPVVFSLLEANDLKIDSFLISKLKMELEEVERLRFEFNAIPFNKNLNKLAFSIESLEDGLKQIYPVQHWVEKWKEQHNLHLLAQWESMNEERFLESLEFLTKYGDEFSRVFPLWKSYLSNDQVQTILKNGFAIHGIGEEFNLNQVYAELVAFDKFLTNTPSVHLSIFNRLETQFFGSSIDEQIEIFWNSWFLTWISHLEQQHPVLAEAGTLKMQHELEELKLAILSKRKISRFISLSNLREQVVDRLEFNRLGNRLTYRDLLHQVSKKRQRWTIRKLIEEMGAEVFRLLPCWLASPETVSALFPMEQNFDLVIFDEASQCQVERGLPAMLRGKQVVVAGDSKQLRPSDFYQVKWDSREEGVEHEAESLLELASSFFEKHQLKGHYRSADPALIYFSNIHFYENQLETLPDYTTSISNTPAITWEKVAGLWLNQVNIAEADAVVLKVQAIHGTAPMDTIGIVTGNFFQMELIREKLWEAGAQHNEIKVRNIENVQGDEFDQVILSFGYAPNVAGKLVTNFGLLGKAGAENRLNVAISRARKAMHVISSLDPNDFRPSHLKNPGLVLFRGFLAFAYTQSKKAALPSPVTIAKGFEVDWSLRKKLMEASGFSEEIPSGVMDLIFKEPTGEKKAVLTDDQRFFNTPTAKAAVAYHPILLEEKGWRFDWKWSRSWIFE